MTAPPDDGPRLRGHQQKIVEPGEGAGPKNRAIFAPPPDLFALVRVASLRTPGKGEWTSRQHRGAEALRAYAESIGILPTLITVGRPNLRPV